MPDASDRVCAVVFGKKLPEEIVSHPFYPDWMEKSVTIFNYECDTNLEKIESLKRPNVYVTFGDWQKHKNLSNAASFIRERWINLDENLSLDEVGAKIFSAYEGFCFKGKYNEPLVSVITPTYKTGQKIFRPLESLLDQTYKNWEWILFDDSDDDGETYRLLSKVAATDSRIKLFKPHNRSGRIGDVKKNAFSLGRGEFLCELDHDDVLTDTCLEDLVKSFEAYPEVGMCYTDCVELIEATGEATDYGNYAFGYGKYKEVEYKGKTYRAMDYPRLNQKTIRHIVGVPNHVRCWRASTYHQVGGHNPNLHVADDYELIVKTFLASRICHIPKLGYIQYTNQDQSNTTDLRRHEIQRMVEMVRKNYDKKIHNRLTELGLPDIIWDESHGMADLHKDIPLCEKHACIISEIE